MSKSLIKAEIFFCLKFHIFLPFNPFDSEIHNIICSRYFLEGDFLTVTCFCVCIIAGPLFIWSISLGASSWLPYRMYFGSHSEQANAARDVEIYSSLFAFLKLFYNCSGYMNAE
jgi:hypothetical protein